MTTLLEATQRYSVNIEGYIVLDPNGAWVRFADIEQAIAQEQRNKNAVPLDMVRFGGRCNIHPLNILPCTACEELIQRKLNEQKPHSQFGSPDMQAMIIANLASQTASTNPVVSQKAAGTVDKDCGNCKKFSTNSLTGGPVCISCKDYSNWEPKP